MRIGQNPKIEVYRSITELQLIIAGIGGTESNEGSLIDDLYIPGLVKPENEYQVVDERLF